MPRLRDSDARALTDRAAPLMEEAAERSRVSMRARLERLRLAWRSVLQVSVAAGLAWFFATDILGHEGAFFAPVAAIITLGLTISQRGRRAVEVAFGVALGILVGDLIVLGIGVGAAQLTVVVMLAMALALFLGSGQMLATQAAVSAALVATIQPPTDGFTFDRFFDSLSGAVIALLVNALLLPADPVALVRRTARPLFDELAATLDDIAEAVLQRERDLAEAALMRARGIDELSDHFGEAVEASREMTRFASPRRRLRGRVEDYADVARQADLAVRNVRVLARGAIRAVRLEENVPPQIAEAIHELAAAVRALADVLDGQGRVESAREHALRAATTATLVLEQTGNLSVSVIVGQVRSTATDLLAGTGIEPGEAVEEVSRAVQHALGELT